LRFLVTGAAGFLGSRATQLLVERGHEVVAVVRPGGRSRAVPEGIQVFALDAGHVAMRDVMRGCDAVLHFAGVPDPAGARADPPAAVRQNAGTTVNLLEGCLEQGCGLLFPSTVRAAAEPPPDPYALSKRLGEEACRLHPAPATVVRLTSVFGPGQVAWEGATGAIAAFAARALEGAPIVIPGDPRRTRDFVYVDDIVPALERIAAEGRWNETITLGSGVPTPLVRAAELAAAAAGSEAGIETPGGDLPAGENESYEADARPPPDFRARPLEEGVKSYVEWLSRHPAAQERARA
jgi:UDP-glucose 4-epimerase